ncbi:multi-sensor signal transduction histidine kinase [Candidatus Magnetobacterium bavaricum]|uniref:histidine kinase n=1 Tax=Candidatus Magnetobacterium bavaricum TaxID=29290 RepID=A0A0F3GYI4_9BACT|nr:multi-sensor signal transduction histidine kinase [Candidatus Magnetobacterium bavaricum]
MNRLLRLISVMSLTLKMLVLTVIVGVSVGGLLGMLLDKRIDETLNTQLRERLSIKAKDDRSHFDNVMISYHQSVKLFVRQVDFAKYVAGANFNAQNNVEPVISGEHPSWLPKSSVLRFFAHIEFALLLDPAGRVREVYSASLPTVAGRASDKPIPEQLLKPNSALISSLRDQYFITTFNNVPYILTGNSLENDDGSPLATMIIASPIDDSFLADAIRPINEAEAVVLVDTFTKRVLCSNTPDVLHAGTPIDSLKDRYMMMGKSFLDYGEADTSMQFISLISNSEISRLKLIILSEDRRHLMLLTTTMILSFMAVLFYIMRRIKGVNLRIEAFSREVLGVNGFMASKGSDQLAMLEGRFLRLFDEIRLTNDRLLEKTEELGRSEQRVRIIIDNIPMGIVTLHETAKILSINPATEKLFGYTEDEAMALNIETFLGDSANVEKFYNITEPMLFEMTARGKDGFFFPIEVAISSVDMGSEQVSIAIIRDITRRKQTEEAIKRARENLESRVETRTGELSFANQQLSLEIYERKKTEELLRRNYDIQRVISSVLTIALEPLPVAEQLSRILNVILSIPWLSIQSKGCIFLVGDDPGVLEMVASHGFFEEQILTCARLPFGRCVCGKAASLKKVVFVPDINDLHDIRYDNVAQHGHYCVPVISGERVLGVVNLYVVAGHVRDTQEEGFLVAIANTLTGILERRFMERKLKHAQDMFFSFMKNSPMAAFIKDESGKYIYANEQIARFTNMTIEDIVGKTDFDLFPPETATEVRAHDDMVLAVNKTVDLVETFRQEDGIHQWLVIKFPFKDETGKRMLAGMSIDMTARKRIEEALRKSEEKYHNIINTTPEGFFEVDRNLRIIEVNEALCLMLNKTQAELIGQQLYDTETAVGEEEGDDNLVNGLVGVFKTGNSIASNVTFKRHDGRQLHSRINISAIKDTDGVITGAFAMLADISELVEIKDSLSLHARELKRSNEELQEFASVASHDLQEPLRKIIAFGDRLKDKHASNIPAEGLDYLSRMQGAAARMQTLIDGLLNFARVTTRAKPFSPTDLNEIIKDVLSDLEVRLIKCGGRVEVDLLPTIDADKMQMQQLFMNLIGNGLKFHRVDVPPVVLVKCIVGRPGASDSGKEGFCEITVSDNGIGFDERYLDRLFKPFQRLVSKEKYEGTGMGLAICEKIVKRHGGEIVAHSVPNEGSTFLIRLPSLSSQQSL